MANAYKNVFFDDKIVPLNEASLSVACSAVLYGLSVYTVFSVCLTTQGSRLAFRLGDHFQRLQNSAAIIGIDTFDMKYDVFEKAVRELMAANTPAKDVFVRATVHVVDEIAGTRSRGLQTKLSMFVYDAEPILPAAGARLKTSVWRRVPDYAIPSRAKVNGAYVNSVLAKQDALDSGYDDCIFLDVLGHVCELSAANIFLVRDGTIITPNVLSDLLEGINRRTVLELAAKAVGLPVVERTVDLTELYIADEIFATGTSAYIAPIIEVDKRPVGTGRPGHITQKLQTFHADLLHGKNPTHKKLLTIV